MKTSSLLFALIALAACRDQPPPTPVVSDHALKLERGAYLVEHAAGCPHCHSPKDGAGKYDRARWLSGVDCYIDVAPDNPGVGCLATRNLTAHETGLKNRSDAEIKAMLTKGVRPDGKALHPFMPYPYFANMRDDDLDAIVAYLRTVRGVEHSVPPSQPPFTAPPQPAPPIDVQRMPMPRAEYAEREAALRGRYLALSVSACVSCHTPREDGQLAIDKAFQGGLSFERSLMRLDAPYPEVVYSANITPHATGIADYSVADVVRALKHGVDREGRGICPPMPVGPDLFYGGLSDADAEDIAHYLLALPPRENTVPNDCFAPPPSDTHAAP